MRYTSLLTNLRKCGLTVIEIDGWRTRGSSSFNPRGAVNHHTAGPLRGVSPSLGIVINGRSDVPGPLCNVFGGRDHVARLVAAGRANHAGRGGVRGLVGNSSVLGLEMEHCGYAHKEPVTKSDIDFMARVQAAFCLTGGFGANMVVQHWEWTTRKIDYVKGTLDPDYFRSEVQGVLDEINKPKPKPKPPKPKGLTMDAEVKKAFADLTKRVAAAEDAAEKALKAAEAASNQRDAKAVRLADSDPKNDLRETDIWIVTAKDRRGPMTRDALNAMYLLGLLKAPNGGPGHETTVPAAAISHLPRIK